MCRLSTPHQGILPTPSTSAQPPQGTTGRCPTITPTDFIRAELQVGLTFSILRLQSMYAGKTSRNTPMLEQPPSSRRSKICYLRFHSAAAVYGLTFRKG
ncbi:MAG: hypothetical protein WA738_12180 [Candidatus Angelobacter sp.]